MPDIDREIARAKEIAERQSTERAGSMSARFPKSASSRRRAAFFNVISGTAAGVAASQGAIQRGDALSAAILGAGGALQGPTMEEIEYRRMESMPIGSFSPELSKGLSDRYGLDLSALPVGMIQKLSPIFDRGEQLEERMRQFELLLSVRQESLDETRRSARAREGLSSERLKGDPRRAMAELLRSVQSEEDQSGNEKKLSRLEELKKKRDEGTLKP